MFAEIGICALGALASSEVGRRSSWGAVRASAGTSLVFSLFAYLLRWLGYDVPDEYLSLFYAGSFVGMSSLMRLNRLEVIIAGIGCAFIIWRISPFAPGMGGVLGLSAFLSVFFVLLGKGTFLKLAQWRRS